MTRLALILAIVSALAIGACGGADDRATDQGAESASQGSSDYIVPSSDLISSDDSPSVAQHPGDEENDEESETGADPVEPCRLVSHNQASTILGEGVRTSVGPQGPTCIYIPKGSKPQMTVAIEQISFQGLRSRASRATRVTVGSRAGWCLGYGSTSVAVPLSEGTVLRVTGPCSLAARFAARALDRVPPA
jgi:hypothetical protein